ncbi:putative Peroxidase 48 [Rhodamnia argentea]|uniref:Peroxidase n=1 Tax=Rhodamnia argentea TaxID=178133 RepID=A0A8B8NSQ4_9MYRT|nr:putative Peroxidase 48 [Rhodamnia argentea]
MDCVKKLSLLTILLCIYMALTNPNADTAWKNSPSPFWFPPPSDFARNFSSRLMSWPGRYTGDPYRADSAGPYSAESLEYDYYRESCPQAEKIVREAVRRIYGIRSDVAPSLLRLVFHDCFIEGCDASVLLDSTEVMDAEKDTPPNETLKGFEIIDVVKAEIEEVCPSVVSCADILVLAAREGLLMAGGPFYPLSTGRRDSTRSYADLATYQLPSPYGDLSDTLASFGSKGFGEREIVNLLGAHSIGVIHCKSFQSRLYNFSGTSEPDPSLDVGFLNLMRSKCSKSLSAPPSLSPAPSSSHSTFGFSSLTSEEPGIVMNYEGPSSGFGTQYYRRLLQGKGVLYADQQLMVGEETGSWVRAYASDVSLFRRDFAETMMKLSNLQVLTAPNGQVRRSCSKVA